MCESIAREPQTVPRLFDIYDTWRDGPSSHVDEEGPCENYQPEPEDIREDVANFVKQLKAYEVSWMFARHLFHLVHARSCVCVFAGLVQQDCLFSLMRLPKVVVEQGLDIPEPPSGGSADMGDEEMSDAEKRGEADKEPPDAGTEDGPVAGNRRAIQPRGRTISGVVDVTATKLEDSHGHNF
jgi:hypothetical protein